MTKIFLLSPGHGYDTPGKCAPDKSFYEWEWNRKLIDKISELAEKNNIPIAILDYEKKDTPLKERVKKANTFGKNCCYVSIHVNAAGSDGKFKTARGWSIFTSRGFTKADPIARIYIEEAEKLLPEIGSKVRKYSQKKYEEDWEAGFYVLNNTIMPAVLVEHLFMDNRADLEILKSEKGIETLAQIHIRAMKRIMEEGL